MNYKDLTAATWKSLNSEGSLVIGYKSIWLSERDNEESNLHIFKDESGHCHFAIRASGLRIEDIEDPGVNGLQVALNQYRLGDGDVNQFIDIRCGIESYIQEFTEVIKEIAQAILQENEKPETATKKIIKNWLSFWTNQSKNILTEEDQTGLLCELLFLEKVCALNSGKALNTWTGPLGEKHDFNFTDWNIEVKGTRKKGRIHTVNGMEQLQCSSNKKLGFVSYVVSARKDEGDNTINLPTLIRRITHVYFTDKPDLVVRFNELLAGIGYNPVHRNEYVKFNLEVNAATLYEVDEDFPKLTSSMLNKPLDTRIASVRYNISCDGISGTDLEEINWGDYFY